MPCGGGKITTDKTQSAEWSLAAFVLRTGLVAVGCAKLGEGAVQQVRLGEEQFPASQLKYGYKYV